MRIGSSSHVFDANSPFQIAFRDREAGSVSNRGRGTDDGVREDRHSHQTRGNRGRDEERRDRGGRGGRGGTGGRGRPYDRHNRGPPKYAFPPSPTIQTLMPIAAPQPLT